MPVADTEAKQSLPSTSWHWHRVGSSCRQGNPRSQELLEQNGIEVIPVEFDEVMKGFGAIHCCTAFLKRG